MLLKLQKLLAVTCCNLLTVPKSQIRTFLGSFSYRKSAKCVPIRKSQTWKILWLIPNCKSAIFTKDCTICPKPVLKVVFYLFNFHCVQILEKVCLCGNHRKRFGPQIGYLSAKYHIGRSANKTKQIILSPQIGGFAICGGCLRTGAPTFRTNNEYYSFYMYTCYFFFGSDEVSHILDSRSRSSFKQKEKNKYSWKLCRTCCTMYILNECKPENSW